MLKRILVTILFGSLLITGNAQLQWPAITQQTKPWTRWWWQGSAVNKKDLSYNMQLYKEAGLGGMEITPIYGVKGYENQFISFLSPEWMQVLDYTMAEGKRLDLGIDLANATGWPFGGPWITEADASKAIYCKTYQLSSGDELKEPVTYQQEGLVRTANNKQLTINEVVKPLQANKDLQSLALDQIIYPGSLPLQLLMAYSDKGAALDITNKVAADGKLNWKAPQGNWTLYALFMGLHGKMVERAAPGGEGYAIDHFSAKALQDYLKKFDDAFKGNTTSGIRAFFNDSYEVDDAMGQANWTPEFLMEFQKRRGYDLRNYLPALFGKGGTDTARRVLYDYRATIGELILDNFTKEWVKWGHAKGALIRNQSHGSPANLLDLYAAVDIPETEGNDVLRFKFATSAAHVTGKQFASSESATWLNEHFLSSWGDVKKAVDLFFLGGVNHIFYHGTEYSPKDAPWPGWLFYAAVHFQPTNPQWKDFHALNEYVTRCQSFLQNSQPDNDVLLYFPIVDKYADGDSKELLQHFDGMERNFEETDFNKLSTWMLEQGYSFDFFSDRQLQNFTVSGNNIQTGGNNYQTVLLPDNKYMPLESFQKLVELAKNGATVLCYKAFPVDVPGYSELTKHQAALIKLKDQLQFKTEGTIRKAAIGKGAFIICDSITDLIAAAKVRKEAFANQGLSFIRKKNGDGYEYFICNRTDKAFEGWAPLNATAGSVALFDPMFGKYGLAKWRNNDNGNTEVYLQLKPYESIIVETYNAKKTGNNYPYLQTTGDALKIKGIWSVEFTNGGPTLPAKVTTDTLVSWTTFKGDDVKNFSGTGKYTISFVKPAGNATAYLLDLGKVHETAEVILNGKKIATLIGPSFQVVIPATDLKASNTMEVTVANLMANRIAYMDKNGMEWKMFYNTNMPARKRENTKNGLFSAADWSPLPSGLLGPVTLTPVSNSIAAF
jgi:hypothetical protein